MHWLHSCHIDQWRTFDSEWLLITIYYNFDLFALFSASSLDKCDHKFIDYSFYWNEIHKNIKYGCAIGRNDLARLMRWSPNFSIFIFNSSTAQKCGKKMWIYMQIEKKNCCNMHFFLLLFAMASAGEERGEAQLESEYSRFLKFLYFCWEETRAKH